MTPTLAFVLPGGMELFIILFVLLLLFGAKKLPDLAKGIGRSMGEFKKARQEFDNEVAKGENDAPGEPKKPAATPAGEPKE